MTDKWWIFYAYNTESVYGFGSEKEAVQYCQHLNAKRDINQWGVSEFSEDDNGISIQVLEDGLGFPLDEELELNSIPTTA